MSENVDTAAPAGPNVYSLRANAFVNRRTYRLTDDALTWEEDGKPLDGVFYDGIAEIRLAYAPTRAATNRYRAQIIFREGGMAELFNTDYRGILDFPEQNEGYVAFLRELHRRVAATGSPTRFLQGNSTAGYIGNLLLTVFIFLMIIVALLLLLTVGMLWMAALKLMIAIYFVPTLIRYINRARPALYDPLAVPADVLPAVAQGSQSN